MIQYDEAINIAEEFAKELTHKFHEKIVAVFVIGSLGSDYYRPGQSDIDTVVITSCNRNNIKKMENEIEIIQDKYWKLYKVPKGFGAIIFAEEQLYPPYIKEEELILEILRLKMQSKLIFGSYNVESIPVPDKKAIKYDAIAFQEWADNEKKNDPYFGVHDIQTLVNSTLIALKRYLMIKHGIIEFNKFKVIDLYRKNTPPIVNGEVFDFIELLLHNNDIKVNGEKLTRMIKWHDELYTIINNLVLYN